MEKRIDETNRELTFESGHSGSARSYAGRRLAALRGRINPPAVIAGGPVRKVMKLCIIAIRSFLDCLRVAGDDQPAGIAAPFRLGRQRAPRKLKGRRR